LSFWAEKIREYKKIRSIIPANEKFRIRYG
jgi:hypothetical protein